MAYTSIVIFYPFIVFGFIKANHRYMVYLIPYESHI
jgi:hypothetical protein